MNRDDPDAWEQATTAWLRPYQEEAYAELDSLSWWVRQQYNLLPTDPRYLNLTEGELRVEYWLHVLTARRAQAQKEGIAVETLDDLLTGATIEEKMAKIDAELERQAQEKQRMMMADTGEREPVISWKANETEDE